MGFGPRLQVKPELARRISQYECLTPNFFPCRMNVVHEAGLFQGRLGFTRAVVMLEEGCEQFSNIEGLGQIRFPHGNIAAAFEEVRRVLEREGLIA